MGGGGANIEQNVSMHLHDWIARGILVKISQRSTGAKSTNFIGVAPSNDQVSFDEGDSLCVSREHGDNDIFVDLSGE